MMAVVIAIDEFGKRFLAGDEIVGGGQTHAHFERSLAGDSVEISLGENAQGLAEMGEQGVADLCRYSQFVIGLLMLTPGVERFREHRREIPGIEAEALITGFLFQKAAVKRWVVPFHVDYEETVVTDIRPATGVVSP